MNVCHFSQSRQYRYSLIHRWDDELMLIEPTRTPRLVAWIGLNPSTADEQDLDPTLRRIKVFSRSWGYDGFVMLNLFAWRDKDPKRMMRQRDPVGHENDSVIYLNVQKVDRVVAAWGKVGGYLSRADKVAKLLTGCGANVVCLGYNGDGTPKHPLYVRGDMVVQPWIQKKK